MAHLLLMLGAMKMTTATCLVRWILCNGTASIACEVGMNPDRSFDVRIVPESTPAAGIVERYPCAVAAMARHAQVALSLRESGWFVAARAGSPFAAAA
jgi:hypothetical protein